MVFTLGPCEHCSTEPFCFSPVANPGPPLILSYFSSLQARIHYAIKRVLAHNPGLVVSLKLWHSSALGAKMQQEVLVQGAALD